MNDLVLYKALQRRLKFRGAKSLQVRPLETDFDRVDLQQAQAYCDERLSAGISLTFPGQADYPWAFYQMKDPPVFLEYTGFPFWLSQPMVSVVGSRKIHSLSVDWIEQHLLSFLQKARCSLVSGGAYGVDIKAHQVALRAGVSTIVVLPTGLDRLYPAAPLHQLKEAEPDQVTFLTEFEAQQTVQKSFFYHRNRLIAALGKMLVVVQCEAQSGSLLTVHHALENGRPILTIPSHPCLLSFQGNHHLLRDGAVSVLSDEDLLFNWQSESHLSLDYLSNRGYK